MARIVMDAGALQSAQTTLKKATETAQQCAQDAQSTINQLNGNWEGVAASSYIDLLSEITPKMNEAVQVYNDISTALKNYVAKMSEADKL